MRVRERERARKSKPERERKHQIQREGQSGPEREADSRKREPGITRAGTWKQRGFQKEPEINSQVPQERS